MAYGSNIHYFHTHDAARRDFCLFQRVGLAHRCRSWPTGSRGDNPQWTESGMVYRRGDSRPTPTTVSGISKARALRLISQSVDGSSSDASASDAPKDDGEERPDGLLDTAMLYSTKWQYYKKQKSSWYWQFLLHSLDDATRNRESLQSAPRPGAPACML